MRKVAGGVALLLAVVLAVGVVAWRLAERSGRSTSSRTADRGCAAPVFTTSANTTWEDHGYVVDQDMWNNSGGTQTLHACSYRRWYVTGTQSDPPSVKAYPDVSRDLRFVPFRSFSRITSRFGSDGPGTGVYEFTYDVWFNGTATPASSEIMIWTDNHGNVLHVPQRGSFTSGGRSYSAWRAGHFIAFVADQNATSGELDLKAFFDHAVDEGWLPADATIGRIEFGVEICSTGGRPSDFGVTDFAVSAG